VFVVLFVGLFKVVTAFVFVVCWVVVSFAPHGKKIKPRRAFVLNSCQFAEVAVFVVCNNVARLRSCNNVAAVCGANSYKLDDVGVVIASVNYKIDYLTESLACYVYESAV
jgi:hypothetical protein